MCCELLSNYYLCSGKNNSEHEFTFRELVVNCFRITIFAVAKTITLLTTLVLVWLWIAFELLSLQWQKQYRAAFSRLCTCCELLSNYYLCSGKNNGEKLSLSILIVVNCFRITIFAVAKTIWYNLFIMALGCELLSNYYLCSGKNNIADVMPSIDAVVNCFRITIFAVAKTIRCSSS